MKEHNAYILGTDPAELNRLGIQHQIWASEAQKGWDRAGFSNGQTLLDLGCGPGFASRELAYVAGQEGKVIGIDKSDTYIAFLNDLAKRERLNIEGIAADFNSMGLEVNSLDGMYCRWALAWVANPKEILSKVHTALKPGGKMVIHEYFDWGSHSIEPALPYLTKAIQSAFRSFKEQEGDIDVGRNLCQYLDEIGMKIVSTRPMAKVARPSTLNWQWPRSFYHIYFQKLVDSGFMDQETCDRALLEHAELEKNDSSVLFCPILIEVIAEKI